MPPEEKKRPRIVTEEVGAPVPTPPPAPEPKPAPEPELKAAVPETNNIVPVKEPKSSKKSFLVFFLITLGVAMIVIALLGGIYVYVTGTQKEEEIGTLETPTPAPSPTPVLPTAVPSAAPSATSSPAGQASLKSYKLSVLNGSGKIGAAGDVKAILEKEGFKVFYTGNAANFSFTDTVIQAKTGVPAGVVSTAKNALSSAYSVKIGATLEDKNQYDIIVTVGSK